MANWRRLAIDAGMAFFRASGAHRLAEPFTRGVGVILTFHNVRPRRDDAFEPNGSIEITPQFFDGVLTHLRRRGIEIISLDDALARLREPEADRTPFAVLSFDDGYRNLVAHALPVLERHEAPFIAYVTAGFADGAARLWWVELEEAIRRLDRIDIVAGGLRVARGTATAAEKQAAFCDIYARLEAGADEERLDVIAALAAQATLEAGALTRELCLGWSELRALARHPLATIGAHTLTHPRLARLARAPAVMEMATSRKRLADELGVAARHFCYPYGGRAAAGAREFELAAAIGFESAVTTRPGMIFPAHRERLLALPRLSVNGNYQSVEALDILLSGAPFALMNAGRRVAA
ncbi:polysaccharide deacetylase family protein [Methylosinus sp. Sm6]|uniref:polysaccharide deacetylase family protein n=1 Tax=Methylosinus sp. Sm6 TaxID=2866948 RepID=UPI001C99369A|nr:polysaccharide deacetylase family protein [Methylosinus sp. Sm6]MBY6243109.1 polysaccharide deacetylase family protein [Methylosinus sp. Sm6]